MFTGIVEAVGQIHSVESCGGDMQLRIATGSLDLADVKLGDSIATNGVCLTVTGLFDDGFRADVSLETLNHTSLGGKSSGAPVNLEKAMLATSRFGGHIVSGHVDGVGEILSIEKDARSIRIAIQAPTALAKYIAHKGSICIDGISLTVNDVNGAVLMLNIVPHTAEQTIIKEYRPGSQVNLEVDVIARYLERLLLGEQLDAQTPAKKDISLAFLAENGFVRSK